MKRQPECALKLYVRDKVLNLAKIPAPIEVLVHGASHRNAKQNASLPSLSQPHCPHASCCASSQQSSHYQ